MISLAPLDLRQGQASRPPGSVPASNTGAAPWAAQSSTLGKRARRLISQALSVPWQGIRPDLRFAATEAPRNENLRCRILGWPRTKRRGAARGVSTPPLVEREACSDALHILRRLPVGLPRRNTCAGPGGNASGRFLGRCLHVLRRLCGCLPRGRISAHRRSSLGHHRSYTAIVFPKRRHRLP